MTGYSQPVTRIYKTIFNNINSGIVIIDHDFNIIYINKYLSELESTPIISGDNCYKRLNATERQCVGCPLYNKTKTEGIRTVVIEVNSVQSKTFMVKIQPIELEKGKKALLELWVNITNENSGDNQIYDLAFQLESRINEQLELIESQQKAMIQQDKLVSMGKLVAGVAHEINNPIVFIRSNVEILKKFWKNFEPLLLDKMDGFQNQKIGNLSYEQIIKDIPDILGSMYRGTDRVKKIVQSLKSFVKKDTESFSKEKISVENVINEALLLIQGQIKNKMKVTRNAEKGLPLISGSAQRLEQVFVNLFINSFDANATELTINLKKESNNILIEVIDNGSGIPKHKTEKIFDPFFTTKGFEGTGLGLSISFGIIKEHNGKITLSGKKGKGTSFIITLPFEAKTILVVDDDLIVTDIVKKVLKTKGFLVETSTNGKEAVEKMESIIEPSLIITDVHMPEMDGFELINWLRKNERFNKTPILVMTGVEKEIKKFDSLLINDYLAKPFSTKILADTVTRILKEG